MVTEKRILSKDPILNPYLGGFFPSRKDEFALFAALKKGKAAVESWKKWLALSDIYHHDAAASWLLPLMYHNLKTFDISGREMNICKGSYKLHWYQNLMRFKKLEKVISDFDHMGVEHILIKGAALLIEYYEDLGLRSMHDIDVLVPPEQAAEAHSLLLKAGGSPEIFTDFPKLSKFRHSVGFHMENNWTLDLHWESFNNEGIGEKFEFWNSTKMAAVNSSTTKVLKPEYNLFLSLVHSLTSGGSVASIRWIPDSIFILRKASKRFNWTTFLRIIENYHLGLLAKLSLNYLQSTFEINIPAIAFQKIEDIPILADEKKYFSLRAKPNSLLRRTRLHYDNFRLRTMGDPLLKKIASVIPYLSVRWNVSSLWEFPIELINRLRKFGAN